MPAEVDDVLDEGEGGGECLITGEDLLEVGVGALPAAFGDTTGGGGFSPFEATSRLRAGTTLGSSGLAAAGGGAAPPVGASSEDSRPSSMLPLSRPMRTRALGTTEPENSGNIV